MAKPVPITPAELAARVRAKRRQSGLSQQQLARLLGVSQQKLSNWENGKHLRAAIEAVQLLYWLASPAKKRRVKK